MAYSPDVMNFLGGAMNTPPGGNPPPTGGPTGVGAAGAAIAGGPVTPKPTPIRINDVRKINPGTGLPYAPGAMGSRTTSVSPDTVKAIVAHAKAKGQDPYTALAVAYQESTFGKNDPNLGNAWSYNADKGIPETDTLNTEASRLVNALKDKLDYAKRLGFDKKGEAYALQAYNGYGDLRSRLMKIGGKPQPQKFYGNTVTGDKPFLMSEHPLYGQTVISLRDQLLKKHPEIKKLVDATPAYVSSGAAPPVVATVKK